MDGWTEILHCHSGDFKPWPAVTCTVRNYGPRALIAKNQRGRTDRDTDI